MIKLTSTPSQEESYTLSTLSSSFLIGYPRWDKECGDVHLRTDALKQNRTSELVKIGGFEWFVAQAWTVEEALDI